MKFNRDGFVSDFFEINVVVFFIYWGFFLGLITLVEVFGFTSLINGDEALVTFAEIYIYGFLVTGTIAFIRNREFGIEESENA